MTLVLLKRGRTHVKTPTAPRAIAGALVFGIGVVVAGGCGHDSGDAGGRGEARPLAVVGSFGEVGLSPGQFTYPRALDNDGSSLWIIDKSARVQRIDPATKLATAIWSMPDSVLGKPCGVTIYPPAPLPGVEQLVYVPDTHYFRVMVYRMPKEGAVGDGSELVSQFGSFGENPGEFTYLTDVAVLPAADGSVGRIYVSEYGGNDRISVFDKDHRVLFCFGKLGSREDEGVVFNRPQSIAIDAARGRLIVTDACNHRVGVLALDGKLVRWIGSASGPGTGWDEFAYPYGLVLLGDDTAMVTEFGNHRIHHVDLETGETLGLYGKPGRGPGELTNPWAITVLDGIVWVLDSGNARVQGFALPRPVRAAVGAAAGGDPSGGHG